jgi:P4 family phage/plasmid primase-like protien
MYTKFLKTVDDPKPAKDIINNLKNVSFKSLVIKQLVYLFNHHDPKFYELLDTNEKLIGFENGVYDFKTCEFRSGKPDDYLTFSTGYDYIEYTGIDDSRVQDIYSMLKQILPNPEILHYTLTIISKALCAVIDEKFYMWTGISGANGKSTMINFLEYTLGEYITSINVGLLTTKRGNPSNASPDVFRLKGKRIFSFQEPEHDDKIKTGIMKQFTGGDTIIARDLFKSCVSFKLQGTMIMCCNDLPIIESADGGTWRRLRVTEFNSRFCDKPKKSNEFKIDPLLKSKLKDWKQVFMGILIEKYKEFVLNDLNEPEEVLGATNRYKNDNDDFSDFLDRYYIEDKGEFSSIQDVYSKFSMWWMENFSNAKVLDIKHLKKALKLRYGREQSLPDKTKGFRIQYIG